MADTRANTGAGAGNVGTSRSGGLSTRWTLLRSVTANETFTATVDHKHGIRPNGAVPDNIYWSVQLPSWCTGCRVHFMRYVVVTDNDGAVLHGRWVEESYIDITTDLCHIQPSLGDYVTAYVDSIGGVVGVGGIGLIYKPIGRIDA